MNELDLAGWLPIHVYWRQAQPWVDWCCLGERRLLEPFFEQTIEAALRQPFNVLFRHQTPLDHLVERRARFPGVPPSGFVFHMSRCGSTLIAQMLAALPNTVVVSEAPPIDTILRAAAHDPAISDARRIAWLQGMVSALGQPRNGQEQHYIIKFDSWSVVDLPLIRRAFPSVPWIFVYRDPIEVMVSHMHMRGSQMIPGTLDPRQFGVEPAALYGMSLDEYCTRVLAWICAAALEAYQPATARLVEYRQLPELVWTDLLAWFGIDATPAAQKQMRAVTAQHAKQRQAPFVDDTAAKQRAATDEIRHLAAQWVTPLYRRLEALRHT